MKIKYLNENFKKVNTLKASHEKEPTDEDVKKAAVLAIINDLKKDIEQVLVKNS